MDEINIFDSNFTKYKTDKVSPYDLYFTNFINEQRDQKNLCLLDVGCGSGTFANLSKANCPQINVTVIDPSKKMLNNINNPEIKKFSGSLPNNIPITDTFDYIHIKEVLHHITAQSPIESKKIVIESLNQIRNNLKDDGYLFIHEIFYEGYIIPDITQDTHLLCITISK